MEDIQNTSFTGYSQSSSQNDDVKTGARSCHISDHNLPHLPTAQTGISTSQTETKFAKEADCFFSWRFSKSKCSLPNCNTVNIFEAWMLHWKAYLGTEWSCQLLPGSFTSWEAGKLSSDLECRLSRSGKVNSAALRWKRADRAAFLSTAFPLPVNDLCLFCYWLFKRWFLTT